MALTHGRKVVAAAGTPEVLTTNSYSGEGVTVAITAEIDNSGPVVVGGSATVDETDATRTGIPLVAGATIVLDCNPAEVWLDADTSGDGVTFLILSR